MRKLAGWCRWIARLGATALAALFITFLVGEGTPDLREIADREIAGFLAVFVMIAGTLVAWRRDLIGAALLLTGFAAFAFIEGGWPPAPFIGFAVAGFLLLVAGTLRWVAGRGTTAEPAAAP